MEQVRSTGECEEGPLMIRCTETALGSYAWMRQLTCALHHPLLCCSELPVVVVATLLAMVVLLPLVLWARQPSA